MWTVLFLIGVTFAWFAFLWVAGSLLFGRSMAKESLADSQRRYAAAQPHELTWYRNHLLYAERSLRLSKRNRRIAIAVFLIGMAMVLFLQP